MTQRRIVCFAMVAALGLGCVAKQPIALDCLTQEVRIYVDGRLLEQNPDVLKLRADRAHKLYFKRPGHDPELVVLSSGTDGNGNPVLEPADVCAELVPVGLDRELTIEVEEDDES